MAKISLKKIWNGVTDVTEYIGDKAYDAAKGVVDYAVSLPGRMADNVKDGIDLAKDSYEDASLYWSHGYYRDAVSAALGGTLMGASNTVLGGIPVATMETVDEMRDYVNENFPVIKKNLDESRAVSEELFDMADESCKNGEYGKGALQRATAIMSDFGNMMTLGYANKVGHELANLKDDKKNSNSHKVSNPEFFASMKDKFKNPKDDKQNSNSHEVSNSGFFASLKDKFKDSQDTAESTLAGPSDNNNMRKEQQYWSIISENGNMVGYPHTSQSAAESWRDSNYPNGTVVDYKEWSNQRAMRTESSMGAAPERIERGNEVELQDIVREAADKESSSIECGE